MKTDTCAPGVHRLLTLIVNGYVVEDGAGGRPPTCFTASPLRGAAMRRDLHLLALRFGDVMPRHGHYVSQPAVADEQGVVYVPPSRRTGTGAVALDAVALPTAAGIGLALANRSARTSR